MKIRAYTYFCLFLSLSTSVWADIAKVPIYVTPFYDSQGPVISVGKYSKELNTAENSELKKTIANMAKEKSTLTPEQMFVASIRLYELGIKDEAVYWFYEAQYRARLFSIAISQAGNVGNKEFELKQAYGAFQQLVGNEINGYAGCDPDKWLEVLKKVKTNNLKSPDLAQIFPGVKLVDKGEWDNLNKKVSVGMDGLSKFIVQSKPTWKQQRAANNMDSKYCK